MPAGAEGRSPPRASAADWQAIFALLDTALELEPASRTAWLESIAPGQARLLPLLKDLLQAHADGSTGGFMQTPPSVAFVDAAATPALAAQAHVGPYRLLREIGQGGMASVWLAERADGAHQRKVALKLPHRALGLRVIGERFARERAILSTLQHPNIAQVLDAGESDGQPWLALEYVEGEAIDVHARTRGLDARARLALVIPVLNALQHAHGQLVIHRDIKPANVLVTDDGTVKLLDFGVAKLLAPDGAPSDPALTEFGGRAMTPQYASPEQVAGRPLGVTSDVYSLGVLLYELLTGRPPYRLRRDSAAGLEEAIRRAEIVRPSLAVGERRLAAALRGDVDTIVMKALAPDPARRYASAAALGDDIHRHLVALPINARPASAMYRARRFLQRRALPVAMAAAVSLSLLAGTGAALWQARTARLEARKAGAIKEYLIGLFSAADNRATGGRQRSSMTVLELIETGAAGLDKSLDDQPEVKIELLGLVGDIFEYLDQVDRKIAMSERAIELSRRVQGEGNPVQALHVLSIASAHAWAGRWVEAERHLQRGEAMLAALGDNRSITYANMLKLKGNLMRRHGPARAVEARETLRRAAALFDERFPDDPQRVGVLMYLAQAHIALDEFAAAREAADRAVDAARHLRSAAGDIGNAYSLRASVLERSGLFAAAVADYEEAGKHYRTSVGDEHFLTLQNDNLMGQALQSGGERVRGLALLKQTAAAIARIRPGSNTHGNSQLRLGLALLRDGDPLAAEPALAEAEANARQRKDVQAQASALLGLGAAAFAQGHAGRARELAQAALDVRREAGNESEQTQADAELLLAQVALHERQADEAERLIAAALARSVVDARPEQRRRAWLLALRGRAALARADSRSALASTDAAMAMLALPALAEDWALRVPVQEAQAGALCAAGRVADGRQLAAQARHLRQSHQSPASADTAEALEPVRACTPKI